MKKVIPILIFLMISIDLFSQFTKIPNHNIITFQEDSSFLNIMKTTRGEWEFSYINDSIFVVSSTEFGKKNQSSIAVFKNYKFYHSYIFDYGVRTDVIAYYNDELIMPITETNDKWNVLWKVNLKTNEITHISLPENLRMSSFKNYGFISRITFDKATNKVYLFYSKKVDDFNSNDYIVEYDLETGKFSDEIPENFYSSFCTFNGYHYYFDEPWNFNSLKVNDPKANSKKIPINFRGRKYDFYADIGNGEMMLLNEKNKYFVVKDGKSVNTKANSAYYEAIGNSMKVSYNNYLFVYSQGLLSADVEYEAVQSIYNTMLLKPGLFLLIILPEPKKTITNTITTYKEPIEVEFERRVRAFIASSDKWLVKGLEYENCQKTYLVCSDLKDELRKLGISKDLEECESLLYILTQKNKEYLQIHYGLSDYEICKTELIDRKSVAKRMAALF